MGVDADKQLVMQACAGSNHAFEALVTRHYDFMYRIAYRWCGNRADAEDITHNTFLKMADHLQDFRFQSSFRTWLCRLVINTAKDSLRRSGKNDHMMVEIPEDLSDGRHNAETHTYTHEVFALIQKLPPDQRAALILVFAEGMTYKEAADIEECPEGTISWRIHEARKSLTYLIEKGARHE